MPSSGRGRGRASRPRARPAACRAAPRAPSGRPSRSAPRSSRRSSSRSRGSAGRPVQRQPGDRRRRLADARRGTAIRREAEHVGPVQLEQVGEQIELRSELGVGGEARPVPRGDDMRRDARDLPPDLQRAREPRADGARARRGLAAGLDARSSSIDDDSPDGTGEIADRLAADSPCLDVLHRERKEGLGPAYLAGFAACSRRRRPRAGDGLRLLARSRRRAAPRRGDAGADLAIGSRYAKGAGPDWGLSAGDHPGGCLYAQPSSASACATSRAASSASAARCSRRRPRRSARRATRSRSSDVSRARAGFRVTEIPITFADRTEGGSKMSRTIVLEAVWRSPRCGSRRCFGVSSRRYSPGPWPR